MKSLLKRVARLERVNNPKYIVRWPDKPCEHGEETYDDFPLPKGCIGIDISWRDAGNC